MSDDDYVKPFRFVVELGELDLAFEPGTSGRFETVVVDSRDDADLLDWTRAVLAKRDTREPYTRDLLLRETEQAPGIYETEGEPDQPYMVARYHDGTTRELIWCDRGTGADLGEPGDVLLEGVYPRSMSFDAEGDGVEVTPVEIVEQPVVKS